ncbi:protein hmgX [Aspergillus mulundensis]|uniref:Tetratricopeptide repeat protein 36 n=1 Tax=Aspergillus mulundensis TaxID=1810919 RepID=A0A3D8S4E3_9EURO|nr:Uncharacterized protein DSM5745_04730 [Aspergillus mulundensis]RDW81173.1 Uncharacterized protein DSM5745_04730 [Aspergillus mulundensis]
MSATTIAPSKPSLTTNDSAVLQALFDAESSPSSGVTINPSLPQLPAHLGISSEEHAALQAREKDIINPLASTNQAVPEPSQIQSAVSALDALIREHPTYPSAYANRAQALRMLIENEDDQKASPETISLLSSLLSDLGEAITLATPLSPADAVSPTQAKLLADTHTHRAYLLLKISRQLKGGDKQEVRNVPDTLKDIGSEGLEEMASRDFFLGGRYGNKVAQQMAVQTNPYAKMCGAIVKEAMRKEVEGV